MTHLNKKIEYSNECTQVLSPLGNFQHCKGMQVVDEIAANNLIKNSYKIIKHFGIHKIPIYKGGHPDDHSNDKSKLKSYIVGYVKKIFLKDKKICCRVSYSEEGYILHNKYKMSPKWVMEKLDTYNDYRPEKLISIGLTNKPNIKGSGEIIN